MDEVPQNNNPDNNQEISDALRQFETQSEGQPILPVQSVLSTPDGEEYAAIPQTEPLSMAEKLIKYSGGMIKNERQADYVLLIFVVLALGISFYLFFGGGTKSKAPAFVPASQIQLPGASPQP